MLSHISKHIGAYKILADCQHGFRRGLSTITQLTSAVNDWSETLQNRSQSDAIFLDFKKAFDRVYHTSDFPSSYSTMASLDILSTGYVLSCLIGHRLLS